MEVMGRGLSRMASVEQWGQKPDWSGQREEAGREGRQSIRKGRTEMC